jgi:heme exporter protein D
MTQFLAMGGYAWYVWMSYGAVALVVAVEAVAARARRRRALAAARSFNRMTTVRSPRFEPARPTT